MEEERDKDGILSIVDKNKMDEHERAWSDVPPELLSLIFSHLLCGDCVSFRLICESYASLSAADRVFPPPRDPSLSQTPCLLFLRTKVFHPIYNDIYQRDIAKVTRAIIRDSKCGWFLMTQGHFNIFFFNPITKVRIQLPDIPDDHVFECMHFSSPPTSMDCKVIGFVHVRSKQPFEICIIKRNEDSWTIRTFGSSECNPILLYRRNFESSECNPILYKGAYYCLGSGGNLIIYDPKEDECNWSNVDKALQKRLRASYCHSYMVESDGELLAVFAARDGRWVGVFRYNHFSKVLERVHSLGNRMIYVSHPACFSETAVVSGTGNKIYLPMFHGNDGLFYSLATNKFHSYAGYSSDRLFEAQQPPLCIWTKPIFDTTCFEEFDW